MELPSSGVSQRSAVLNLFQTTTKNLGNPITDFVKRKLPMPDELKKTLSLMDDDSAGAQFQLAQSYKKGSCSLAKNEAKAFQLFQQASEKGHDGAKYELALCHQYARGTIVDGIKAFLLMKELAEKGNKDALFNVGIDYQYGIGVEQSYSKASEYYQKALSKGNKDALKRIEMMFRSCSGESKIAILHTMPDEPAKIAVLRSMIHEGFGEAMYTLATYYQSGSCGLARNEAKAFQLIQQAAGKEHHEAMRMLSVFHRFGRGTTVDTVKAFRLMKGLAKKGDKDALLNVGIDYQYGDGVKQSYKKAAKYYLKALIKGNKDALKRLEEIVASASKCPDALKIAVLNSMIEEDYAEAMYTLASYYKKGSCGLAQDVAKAFRLYQQADEKGHIQANTDLGICYIYGIGVAPNDTKAFKVFRRGTEQGI